MYLAQFLQVHGQACTILREPPVESLVSQFKPARAVRDIIANDALYLGMILSDSNLQRGELYEVAGERYLVRSASFDPASGQIVFRSAKTNVMLSVQRLVESVPDGDQDGNLKREWQTIASNIHSLSETNTHRLRTTSQGLEAVDRVYFWMQATTDIQKMDRIVVGDEKFQVDSIDRLSLPGLFQVEASIDVRK